MLYIYISSLISVGDPLLCIIIIACERSLPFLMDNNHSCNCIRRTIINWELTAMVNAIIDPHSPSFSILKPPTNPTCEPIIKSLVNHAIKPRWSMANGHRSQRASPIGTAQRLVLRSTHQWQVRLRACPVGHHGGSWLRSAESSTGDDIAGDMMVDAG